MIDPLTEKYHTISPYAYVSNSPSIAYDGDGRKVIYVNGYFSRLLNLGGVGTWVCKRRILEFFQSDFYYFISSIYGGHK